MMCSAIPGRMCRVFQKLSTPTGRQVTRLFSDQSEKPEKEYVPPPGTYRSPFQLLKDEMKPLMNMQIKGIENEVPRQTDVMIIGGGIVGSSVAYWLKRKAGVGLDVTVVEKDYGYTQASTMLSAGGVRHQFTTAENVKMSMFTSHFLENIREYLSVIDQDPPQVDFHHQGYLFLVPEKEADMALKNVDMQRSCGAKVAVMSKSKLQETYPWLNVDGIELGTYGLQGEGWFDPWQLVNALRQKNVSMGVRYCSGEVNKIRMKVDLNTLGGKKVKRIRGVDIDHPNGKVYGCDSAAIVNCAGPWAGQIADMAGIGDGSIKLNENKLPVEPRKRYVYVIHCPEAPSLDMPFVVDTSGVYVRREGLGGCYICGASPKSEEEEPDTGDLCVDYEFFNEYIWPTLAERIPAFNKLKLRSAWAGFYDYNFVDQNLIIGNHTYYKNFLFANGMSGHGVQHGVAIGRAISEMIIDQENQSIDLHRFRFSRFYENEIIVEDTIV